MNKLPVILSWIVLVVGVLVFGPGAFVVAYYISIERLPEAAVFGGGFGILMLCALVYGWIRGIIRLRGRS